jgi:hypothetical protein
MTVFKFIKHLIVVKAVATVARDLQESYLSENPEAHQRYIDRQVREFDRRRDEFVARNRNLQADAAAKATAGKGQATADA